MRAPAGNKPEKCLALGEIQHGTSEEQSRWEENLFKFTLLVIRVLFSLRNLLLVVFSVLDKLSRICGNNPI